MPDREKVIKGLEYCEKYFNCCDKCPYWDGGTHCTADLAHDTLNLLKEQDAVTVHDPGAFCPKCGWMLYPEDHPKFCGNCGYPVKWE